MKQERYRIGELSRITGISKDTLHFYDKAGLLTPDYVDPENHYRYYSRENLWQIDIITICRRLRIPLEQVKRVLSTRDGREITELLLRHRERALELSRYYARVAEDIAWYQREQERIDAPWDPMEVRRVTRPAEIVIAGASQWEPEDYHAELWRTARSPLEQAGTIQRKYGYVLDVSQTRENRFIKTREYILLPGELPAVEPEALMTIPAGEYLTCGIHVSGENADFLPLLRRARELGVEIDGIYAQERGLQLFPYLGSYDCDIMAHIK